MPSIDVSEETIELMDGLLEEDESYDELIRELINIYQAEEYTLHHSGD